MFYDAIRNDHGFAIDPVKALIAPRPIAWISTRSGAGVNNLAPYSFFNAFSDKPYYVAFGSGGRKDTLVNAEETGCFAVNLVSHGLRDAMNASSARAGSDVDEFALAGLKPAACRMIEAPRVAESPATLECRHHLTVPLPGDDGVPRDFLVIGRVVGVHIDDRYLSEGRVNTGAMELVARLGYAEYATVRETWRMRRPD
ncbi:MAG: flavin reductase family protein [Proteobacteria bacterium]|nr:flavin reductase family protein [Pseudomonadota bacterium]